MSDDSETRPVTPPPPRPADPLIGIRVGEYHIRRVLGRGGMGVVYEAEDTALGIPVALKSISAAFARDATFVRRFRTEARAMARVASPHIVRVMALRETEHGLFIVMEYVDGGDFYARMAEGPMPWRALWPFLRQMLLGLEAAHAVGVVHRDIKPRNVLLTRDGTIKLTDFGLARLQADGEATVTQAVAGTLAYMSPEQIRALPTLDGRSDLFSLGLTAYEALAGRLPFDRSTGEFTVMRAIVDEPFPLPMAFDADVPPAVAGALMRALEKDPDQRYASAAEMREALAAAGDDEEPTRTRVPTHKAPKDASKPPKKPKAVPVEVAPVAVRAPGRGGRTAAIGAGVLLLAAAVGGGYWMTRPGRILPADVPGVTYVVDGEPARGEVEVAAGTVAVRCLAGGLSAAAEVEVRRGRTHRVECFRPDLAVDVAAFWNGDPAEATVLVDGQPGGAVPVRLTLGTGRHTLRIQGRGRLDSTVTVDVRPTFDPEAPGPVSVAVRGGVDATPPDAPVASQIGPPPVYSPGPVYNPAPAPGPSAPRPQPQPPRPQPSASVGTLVAEVDAGVTLSVDGSGISSGSRDLRPGTYTAVCAAGPLSESMRVTVSPGQRTPVRCYASERVVSVSATSDDPSRPWMGIVVDGQAQGQTPAQITLRTGRHVVFVRRRGYTVVGEDRQTVDVPPRFSPSPLPPVALSFQVRSEASP